MSLIAKLSILYYLAIQPIAGKILVSAKRILFLADTKNLGEQAEQEFMTFVPNDDNRKFTELYSVQCLKSSHISTDSQIYISTIQRMYAMLKDKNLTDLDNLPEPNDLAEEIIENLEAGLNNFREVLAGLASKS